MIEISIYEQLDKEVAELGSEFKEWRHPKKLDAVSKRLRKLGSHRCGTGEIKGFVPEVNGVDVSSRVMTWPDHALNAEKLVLKMQVLGTETPEPKRCLIEFAGEKSAIPVFSGEIKPSGASDSRPAGAGSEESQDEVEQSLENAEVYSDDEVPENVEVVDTGIEFEAESKPGFDELFEGEKKSDVETEEESEEAEE